MRRVRSHVRPRHRRSHGGFTLLEVLICVLLLVIAGAGGLAMVVAQIRTTAFSSSAQTASRLGQQVLDQMQIEPFATLGVGNSACKAVEPNGPIYATGDPSVSSPGNMVQYTRSCAVTPLTNGMKTITVSVTWSDADGRTRTINVGSQRAP